MTAMLRSHGRRRSPDTAEHPGSRPWAPTCRWRPPIQTAQRRDERRGARRLEVVHPAAGHGRRGVLLGLVDDDRLGGEESAAIDAAFCSAERVTLAASMTPALNRSSYSPVAALRPSAGCFRLRTFSTTTPPSRPALTAICLSGSSTARATMRAPVASSPSSFSAASRIAGLRTEQGHATAGDDALFDRGLGRRDGVLDAVLLLLELDLGGRADLDDGDAAGQLGQALLELLPVVVGVGVLDLGLDLVDPALDVGLGAGALDDRSSRPW